MQLRRFLCFSHCSPIIHCAFCFYPCGICEAPICCPGASTWQTTKCLVISCMSSLLKRVLKHSLSAEGEERKISGGGRGRRGCNVIKYALAPGEGREGGAICAQVIDARTSRPTPPTNQMSRSPPLALVRRGILAYGLCEMHSVNLVEVHKASKH